MNEKPILFTTEMVEAILEGRKTQTRRVIKPQPPDDCPDEKFMALGEGAEILMGCCGGEVKEYRCPYGTPYDQLWVRETWRIFGWNEGEPYRIQYKADGEVLDEPGDSNDYDEDKYIQYWLDCAEDCEKAGLKVDENEQYYFQKDKCPTRWRSSIHMPRWASRITLLVKDIRVERVQEISKEDAIAEGLYSETTQISTMNSSNPTTLYRTSYDLFGEGPEFSSPIHAFEHLWNSTYAKRGHSWNSNPWVWVIEFEVLEDKA